MLVGDFPSIDDPAAQKTLERIKGLPSKVLEGETASTPMDEVRQLSTKMVGKLSGKGPRGPMGRAFFTRNPLLPQEYFVPKGVDDFVAKMNQGVEHSLLDCPAASPCRSPRSGARASCNRTVNRRRNREASAGCGVRRTPSRWSKRPKTPTS